nr:glycosyltransferase [Rhodoferax sp.]
MPRTPILKTSQLISNPNTPLPNPAVLCSGVKLAPLVSILIRSMDRGSLPDALTSVGAQTYQSIEVILVNAKGVGHKDFQQWQSRFPIRFVNSSTRLDRSAAANRALENANGDYLIFLDDDDFIDSCHIESLVNALLNSPNCKAAYSGTRVTDATGTTLGVYDHSFSSMQLLVGNYLPIHAVLFSRDLVSAGCRFDSTLETYEDWDFWLQVSRHTSFVKTGKVSAAYRPFLGDSGMSKTEDRPLQRQRRSVVWQKWWRSWKVETLDLLAVGLEERLEKKESENIALTSEFALQHHSNAKLAEENAQRTHELVNLQTAIYREECKVVNLNQTIAEIHAALTHKVAVLEIQQQQIDILNKNIALTSEFALQHHSNAKLDEENAQRTHELANLQTTLNKEECKVVNLNQTIAKIHTALTQKEAVLEIQQQQIDMLNTQLREILTSSSWRMSAPIRRIGSVTKATRRKIRAVGLLISSTWSDLRRESLTKQLQKAYEFMRHEGWAGVKLLLTHKTPEASHPVSHPRSPEVMAYALVPSSALKPERHGFQLLDSIDSDQYNYFFIDVFDTAVIRLFEKPVDIFKYVGCITHSFNFEKKRIQKERDARTSGNARKDIRLVDIYKNFLAAIPEIEIETEFKFCIAHPETHAFYRKIIAKGKKVYFVSDMYLSKDTLTSILNKNGYTQYEDIYVSSEDDYIKGDGSRFLWLQKKHPDSVDAAIHIGDNHISDWVQPIKNGYSAFKFTQSIEFYEHDDFIFTKTPHLLAHNSLGTSFILGMFRYWKASYLDKSPGYWKQFGFLYGGALVSAFCGFLNQRIRTAGLSTSRIFFLARDGEIMEKVYKLLFPEHEAAYLLASRRCMSFPSLTESNLTDDNETLKLFTTPIGIADANDLMDRFGYEDLHELKTAFDELESGQRLHSESDILKSIIDNKDSILSKANSERQMLMGYLESMHFFEDSDIVIADVGWGGSIQNALAKLLTQAEKFDNRLHGMYLGVGDNASHKEQKTGFLFQGNNSAFIDFLNLIELITSSPSDSVMRVTKVDEQYIPVSPDKNSDELNRQSISKDIQSGILEFAEILKARNIGNLDFLQPDDFTVLFESLQLHPSEEDVRQLEGVKHAMTLGNNFAQNVLYQKKITI